LVRLLRRGLFRAFLREFAATSRHLGQSWKQTFFRNVVTPGLRELWFVRWQRWRAGVAPLGHTTPVSRQVLEMARREGIAPRSAQGPKAGDSVTQRKRQLLGRMQNQVRAGFAIPAAAFGLKFTAPFHDKRVVELGLAIPEEMEFKNGRTRHFARVALADLYPPEFQDRRPGNEDMAPDMLALVKRAEARILADIDRMEAADRLTAYFDFTRMRRMLTRRRADQHASGHEYDARQAVNAFLTARWLEFFRGDNR
jgi:asparagine synthase (glutamine-hydrolysing)